MRVSKPTSSRHIQYTVHIADVTKYIFKLLRHDSRSPLVYGLENKEHGFFHLIYFYLFIQKFLAHTAMMVDDMVYYTYECLFINRLCACMRRGYSTPQ